MLTRVVLTLLLLTSVSVWCQVEDNSAEEAATTTGVASANSQMMETPPPVSGAPYQTTTLSEARSNYLRGSILFNSAYSDNVTVSETGKPLSDVTYSIWPTLTLDETTPRMHTALSYSPGFTFYQRFSTLNQNDQNLAVSFRYRLSQHITLSLRDSLQKTSSPFNQPDFLSTTPVSGAAPPVATVIAPAADQLRNAGDVELTYQFSQDQMIGGSGAFTNLHYPDPAQVADLYDSSSASGSVFYTNRFAKKHYLGVNYQYQRIAAYPTGPENLTLTQAIVAFYTIQLKPTLSISVSAGPQYSTQEQAPLPPSHSWSPEETASLGWRLQRTSLAASYSHAVGGGGGLVGAFHSTTASGSVRRQLTKTWTVAASSGYSINKTLNPLFALVGTQGGHSVFGTAMIQHQWGGHLHTEAGYTRLHQSYEGITAIESTPDTNREYVSISYQFSRPLGR